MRNRFKKIARLLAPSRGDTLRVSGSLILKKKPLCDIGFPGFCFEGMLA